MKRLFVFKARCWFRLFLSASKESPTTSALYFLAMPFKSIPLAYLD